VSENRNNTAALERGRSRGAVGADREALGEDAFKRVISVERKRTERTTKPFLLMLLATGEHQSEAKISEVLARITSALLDATRETDIVGWHKENVCVGIVFTDLGVWDPKVTLAAMLARVTGILRDHLTIEQFNGITISFHFYPDQWDDSGPQRPSNPILYPDLSAKQDSNKVFPIIKRTMDIVGGLSLLIITLPLLFIVAAAIQASSKGPILYRQQRIGQYGKPFTFLKFRSMYPNSDATVHKQYVTELIAGRAERLPGNRVRDVGSYYKLTNDDRITPLGALLRRTSLDELPQLFNVLKGDMSLVGPRPAIPYEVAAYQTWHRRRVLEVKPGITGLWQVEGRGRVEFDEMVRLDLRYAKEWSLWLDLKILLRTPRAVVIGSGAY